MNRTYTCGGRNTFCFAPGDETLQGLITRSARYKEKSVIKTVQIRGAMWVVVGGGMWGGDVGGG